MFKGIDHIALAVADIESAADFYQKAFKLDMVMGLSYPADGVHTNLVFSFGPENELEFLGPLGSRGFLTTFLQKHGPGVHHLAIEVPDIEEATRAVSENGVAVFGTAGEKGMRFTFLHPRSTLRTGMQLMQRNPQKPAQNPMVKGIDHVAISVEDRQQGRDFFLNKLGATLIDHGTDEALGCRCDRFDVGNARFHALYQFSGSTPAKQMTGLHHIGILVDDLSIALSHLKDLGILPMKKWLSRKTAFLPPDKMYGCLWQLVQG